MTSSTFQFAISTTPRRIKHPEFLNIEIPHDVTTLAGRVCESSGAIDVLDSAHPIFAKDVDGVMQSWARAEWATDDFMADVAQQDWLIGYDFLPRTCRDVSLPSLVAYLWLDPAWDILVGKGFQMKGGVKYLFLNFIGRPKLGCVYVGDDSVGSPDNTGPVADPSLGEEEPPPDDDDQDADDDEEGGDDSDAESDGEEERPDESDEGDLPPVDDDDQDDNAGSAFNPANQGDDDDDNGAACFPAHATVQLQDGSLTRMDQLQLGHAVRVASHPLYSDVFFFSHRANAHDDGRTTMHAYVQLQTASGNLLTLSSGHYLHAAGRLVAARRVRVGDLLTLSSGATSHVTHVSQVKRAGKYAPHTLHGDIVVDGVLVSTYTTAVHPTIAHYVLLAPLRLLYRLGLSRAFDGVLDAGKESWRLSMPGGPEMLRTVV